MLNINDIIEDLNALHVKIYLSEGVEYKYFNENMRYIDKKISKDLKSGKGIDMRGQKIENALDLAELFTVFRDPRYETMRYIFVKDNEIVGTENVTSRLPNKSLWTLTTNKANINAGGSFAREASIAKVKIKMEKFGADGVYLLHNHPDGNPAPSEADKSMTTYLAGKIPNLLSHVVLGEDTYWILQPYRMASGEFGVHDVGPLPIMSDLGSIREKPDIDLKDKQDNAIYLSSSVNTFKKFIKSDKVSVVFYVTSNGEVNAIEEVDNQDFNNKQVANHFENEMVENGATHLFLVTSDRKLYRNLVNSFSSSFDFIFTEIILVDGSDVEYSSETNPYWKRRNGGNILKAYNV